MIFYFNYMNKYMIVDFTLWSKWNASKFLPQTVIWQIIVFYDEESRDCETELHFKLSILFEAIFYLEPKRTETISCIYVLLTCWSNHMHNKSKKLTIYVKLLRWNLCCQTCASQCVDLLYERIQLFWQKRHSWK